MSSKTHSIWLVWGKVMVTACFSFLCGSARYIELLLVLLCFSCCVFLFLLDGWDAAKVQFIVGSTKCQRAIVVLFTVIIGWLINKPAIYCHLWCASVSTSELQILSLEQIHMLINTLAYRPFPEILPNCYIKTSRNSTRRETSVRVIRWGKTSKKMARACYDWAKHSTVS